MFTKNINLKNYQTDCKTQSTVKPFLPKSLKAQTPCDAVSFLPKYKMGFSSRPLYNAYIEKTVNNILQKVPVKITLLNREDAEDVEAMKQIFQSWKDTSLGKGIANLFLKSPSRTFLALELDVPEKRLHDRIIGLSELNKKPQIRMQKYNDIYVDGLQSLFVPKKGEKDKTYKGIGEVLMAGIGKFAKSCGFTDLTLESEKDSISFYKHIGMRPDAAASLLGQPGFSLKGEALNDFIKKADEKYNISDFKAPINSEKISDNKNKLGFSSHPLYKVNIKQINEKGEESLVPAKITKFSYGDPEDIEAMESAGSTWTSSHIIKDIADNFISKRFEHRVNFLALELDDEKKQLKDRVLCLSEVTSRPAHIPKGYDDCEIKYIQSKSPDKTKYKGAGEVLLYGICKFAKDMRCFTSVSLSSVNHSFYDHIGMPKAPALGEKYYIFRKDYLQKFMEKIVNKYKIDDKSAAANM